MKNGICVVLLVLAGCGSGPVQDGPRPATVPETPKTEVPKTDAPKQTSATKPVPGIPVAAAKPEVMDAPVEVPTVTAMTLWRAYDNNVVAGNAKYKNKTVCVIGIVRNIVECNSGKSRVFVSKFYVKDAWEEDALRIAQEIEPQMNAEEATPKNS